ncbi:hypothetical protein GCM10028807_60470 [Spirosoma daeguense]
MKKLSLIFTIHIIACLLAISPLFGQDNPNVIYFSEGDPAVDTRIVDLTSDKVVVRADGGRDKPFSRSRVVLAFNQKGNFLVIAELSPDLTQAKQQLQTFLDAPARKDGNDYLIKASPLSVVLGKISYDGDVINYKTPQGNSATINKNELIAVLYRDGRHVLLKPVNEAAPLLAELRPDIENGGKPVTASKPVAADTTATSPAPATLTESDKNNSGSGNKMTLTEEEKETYRQKSLARVDEFVNYINVITDKNSSNDEKDRAIEQALRLFIKGSTIEVTSSARTGSRTYRVDEYLNRLKRLPYLYTKVEWADTQFVQDLTQMPDGTYEGTISGQQRFTGYNANGQTKYSDVTQKDVRVKLDSYQKIIDGTSNLRWQTMLGNVSVSSQR